MSTRCEIIKCPSEIVWLSYFLYSLQPGDNGCKETLKHLPGQRCLGPEETNINTRVVANLNLYICPYLYIYIYINDGWRCFITIKYLGSWETQFISIRSSKRLPIFHHRNQYPKHSAKRRSLPTTGYNINTRGAHSGAPQVQYVC